VRIVAISLITVAFLFGETLFETPPADVQHEEARIDDHPAVTRDHPHAGDPAPSKDRGVESSLPAHFVPDCDAATELLRQSTCVATEHTAGAKVCMFCKYGGCSEPSAYVDTYFSWMSVFFRGMPRTPLAAAAPPAAPATREFMIDVGANYGSLAVQPAAWGFRVVAFEPVPANLAVLGATWCANGGLAGPLAPPRLTVVPAAVGAAPATLTIHQAFPPDNSAMTAEAATRNVGGASTPVSVPVVALDAWLAAHPEFDPADCVLLKVDVQGYELRVLEGAAGLLRRATHPRFMVIAEHDAALSQLAVGTASGVANVMRDAGYRLLADPWRRGMSADPAYVRAASWGAPPGD